MPEDHLENLVAVWQEERLQGRDLSVSELCRDCPELAKELAQRIAILRQINDLLGAAFSEQKAYTAYP